MNKILKNQFNLMFKKSFLAKRIAMVLISSVIIGFSLSLLNIVQFGTDACSLLNLGLSNKFGISFGTAQLLVNIIFFAFIIRSDVSQIGIGTLANMLIVGYSMDLFTAMYSDSFVAAIQSSTATRIAVLIPVMIIFIIAAALYMSADLGAGAYDAMPFIISKKTSKLSFSTIRILWDVAAAAIGFALGAKIGAITVISSLMLGPVIQTVGRFVKARVFSSDYHYAI